MLLSVKESNVSKTMQNITWHAICHRAMHVVSDELPLQAVKVSKVVKAKQMQSGHGWLYM